MVAWRCLAAVLVGLALSGVLVTAHAETVTSDSYSLSWVRGEGVQGCPNRQRLAREIEQRLGRNVFAPGGSRSLEMSVATSKTGLISTIHLRDKQGNLLGKRQLESEDTECSSLFAATVLASTLRTQVPRLGSQPSGKNALSAMRSPKPFT